MKCLWNANGGQAAAANEGTITYASDAVRDGDLRKAAASIEGIIPNACDDVGDYIVTAFAIRKLN